ncbi:MAG: hypothetical protein SGPRY_008117 [Prymnesium sp.]
MPSASVGGVWLAAPGLQRSEPLSNERRAQRLTDVRKGAAQRARDLSSSHATPAQTERLEAGLLHAIQFSQLGAAQGTLLKDDLAWAKWKEFSNCYGFDAVVSRQQAITQPDLLSSRLGLFLLWVYPQVNGRGRHDAHPRSVLNNYPGAIARILKRDFKLPAPRSSTYEAEAKGLLRGYKQIYGTLALAPKRRQPMTRSLWARRGGTPRSSHSPIAAPPFHIHHAMAAAAAAGAALPVVGFPAADPALTRVVEVGGPMNSLDPDLLSLPNATPLVQSLAFLGWRPPTAVGGVHTIAAPELQGLCILANSFDLSQGATETALTAANLIEDEYSLAAISRILHELHVSGIFDKVFYTEADFTRSMEANQLLQRNQLVFDVSWVRHRDPFDTPAVAAVAASRGRAAVAAAPAVQGPAELRFLYLTSWGTVINEGDRRQAGKGKQLLARIFCLLSHRSRADTRSNANSDIRAIADTLTVYIASWANLGTSPTPPQLVRHLTPYLSASTDVLPSSLLGAGGTLSCCEAELRDAHTLLRGRESEAASAYWERIHQNLNSFDSLKHFSGRIGNSGATRALMERMMMGLQIATGTPYVRMVALNAALSRLEKAKVIADLFAAGSTPDDVVEEVLEGHETARGGGTQGGVTSIGEGSGDGTGPSTSAMAQREFERELVSSSFLEAVDSMRGQSSIAQIETAALAGSILLLRYLFFAPS